MPLNKFILSVVIILLLNLLFFSSCSGQKAMWKGSIEDIDGVTFIHNPIDPKGEENENLQIEKLFVIDLGNEKLVETGISDVIGFDVDSNSNIYFWTINSSENYIYKFNINGKFLTSFGHVGQGPGELELPYQLRINKKDEIIISDRSRLKLIIYNTEGKLIRELSLAPNHEMSTLLDDERILAQEANFIMEEGVTQMPIVICNKELETLNTLHSGNKIPNWVRAKKINGLQTNKNWYPWNICDDNIFIGNELNGYEFIVYNFDGTLIRRIKKEYKPIAVSEIIKQSVKKAILRPDLEQFNLKDKIHFPEHMPPFQYFFTDDVGRLYVMTNEEGENPGEFIYDIFNTEGIFTGRISLNNSGNMLNSKWGGPFEVKAKKELLYLLRKKKNDFKELVVYKMNW